MVRAAFDLVAPKLSRSFLTAYGATFFEIGQHSPVAGIRKGDFAEIHVDTISIYILKVWMRSRLVAPISLSPWVVDRPSTLPRRFCSSYRKKQAAII